MEKHEALEKGYSFTGVYERSKEMVKEKQKSLEYCSYRTVICPSRQTGYERSCGAKKGQISGYCLFVEAKYHEDKQIEKLKEKINNAQKNRDILKKEYEEKLAKFELEVEEAKTQLIKIVSKRAE